jgi:hypothetical protein
VRPLMFTATVVRDTGGEEPGSGPCRRSSKLGSPNSAASAISDQPLRRPTVPTPRRGPGPRHGRDWTSFEHVHAAVRAPVS